MAWEPENFTPAERFAAAKAVVHAQIFLHRLDRREFGAENAKLVDKTYRRVDDMLAGLLEDIYGYDGSANPPHPPEPFSTDTSVEGGRK